MSDPGMFVLASNDRDLADLDKIDMIESPMFDQEAQPFVNHRVLDTFSLVAIMYLFMCAGPIGAEQSYSAGGPLFGLLGHIFYNLLVAVPYAYIVSELCSAFPEDGGFTVWVMNAFGPFWGFQVGYWSWIAGTLRGALVPTTLVNLILRHYGITIESMGIRWALGAGTAIILSIPVIIGTKSVARLSVFVTVFIGLAFLIFTIWGFAVADDADDLLEIRHEVTVYNTTTKDVEMSGGISIEWSTYLNILFYKYKGINNASVFGGEIRNPAWSYSASIAIVSVLMMITYTVPMTAGLLSNDVNWTMLDKNSFPHIAMDVGGKFLNELVIIAACIGTAGLFMTALFTKAFLLTGMAENRLVPEILATRHMKFQSPIYAVLFTLVCMLPLVILDFEDMLPMTNAYSAAIELLIIATIVLLRRRLPYIPRPTKVPGGIPTLLIMSIFPMFMFGYITVSALTNPVSIGLIGGFLVPGLVYGVYRFHFHRSLA